MELLPKTIVHVIARYRQEIAELGSDPRPAAAHVLLLRIKADLPRLLFCLNLHKSSKLRPLAEKDIVDISNQIDRLINISAIKQARAVAQLRPDPTEQDASSTYELTENTDIEDYATLRKRLLADGTLTSLDDAKSTDQLNQYHETFQDDILSDMTGLATALKNSAMTLSGKILDDAKLVEKTGESMEKSLSLMLTVSTNLNGYLTEKTGGKITVFFLIKMMGAIFLITFFMILIIKILPKM